MKNEFNLQDLVNADEKVKSLKKKQLALETEIEQLQKKCDTLEKETLKKLKIAEDESNAKLQEQKTILNKREKELDSREKELRQREKEAKDIEAMVKDLSTKEKAFAENVKNIDVVIAEAKEKEHRAKLLIEQYEKKLKELEEIKK